jgi:folate-dependent phosphoribosylglycinamide formyltransferase PurN
MARSTISTLARQARDAGIWRPSHARLLLEQVADRGRNGRAGYTDEDHLQAAAAWLERAQDATGNGGVAGRYRLGSGWTSAYPETTGYIIPTFLALAAEPGGERFRERARRAVEFLLALQLPSGAFPGGEVASGTQAPSFFNTGQILTGLAAWHQATGDARAIEAARRAGDWLVGLQDADGAFRRHLYHDIVTTYGAHASCWLAELGRHAGEPRYLEAARRHVDWVLTHQDAETGWIDLCGFLPEHHRARRSVTHTIAYTLCGVLTTAALTGHARAAAAVERAAIAIARRLELSGWLPGVLDSRWRGAASYSCLTGNAQMALVWLTLFERGGDTRFLNAALKAIDLVKRAQPMASGDPAIRGGVPGSDPIWGDYIRMAVPNWSAKFFIDALLQKRAVMSGLDARPRGVSPRAVDVPAALLQASPAASPAPLRVVVLATPSSKKLGQMVRTWTWGFRPSAVVILERPRRSAWLRARDRVYEDGVASLVRKPSAGRPAAPSPAGERGGFDVRRYCRDAGIPALEVASLESPQALDAIRALQPDLFVFAGGAILRGPLLALPRLGTLNAHMGLLPFYRGMNVAEWAAFHGDPVGCSVHLIDPGIDTGDILCVREVSTDGLKSVSALRSAVDDAQVTLLGEVFRYVAASGALPPRRAQAPAEGRQFFRMHPDLVARLERELASGLSSPAAVPEALAVAGASR